jgi:hypothetical protein
VSVSPAVVNVLVVANLFLVPPVAFVMPGGIVTYHAEQIKSNKVNGQWSKVSNPTLLISPFHTLSEKKLFFLF